MIDPEPINGLPNAEYIELKNISTASINLKNYTLSDFSNTTRLPDYTLKSDSCVIITSTTNRTKFGISNLIPVSYFLTLNNDKDTIVLTNNFNHIEHFVYYDGENLKNKNPIKYNGGWSLELIDTRYPFALFRDNWNFSVADRGGTPGLINSVANKINDNVLPYLENYRLINNSSIELNFNKSLDSNWINDNQQKFSINNISIKSIKVLPSVYKTILIEFVQTLRDDIVYDLIIKPIKDLSNNLSQEIKLKFGLPSPPLHNDLIINEILFNPTFGQNDFIEIYNRSNKIIDLQKIYLANMVQDIITTSVQITVPVYIFPQSFKVITTDANLLLQAFPNAIPSDLINNNMPSLPDDEGKIALTDNTGNIIDALAYDEKWHYPLLQNTEGISLERIYYTLNTQDKNNWNSASELVKATPTLQNSQFKNFKTEGNDFELSTNLITPNNDGKDDYLIINYNVGEENINLSIKIFSFQGQLVSDFLTSTFISGSGILRWDATTTDQQPLSTGNYIILFEVINTANGYNKSFKKMITIAQ